MTVLELINKLEYLPDTADVVMHSRGDRQYSEPEELTYQQDTNTVTIEGS